METKEEIKTDKVPKKRGRPRKTVVASDVEPEVSLKETKEIKTKKRGRPRKVKAEDVTGVEKTPAKSKTTKVQAKKKSTSKKISKEEKKLKEPTTKDNLAEDSKERKKPSSTYVNTGNGLKKIASEDYLIDHDAPKDLSINILEEEDRQKFEAEVACDIPDPLSKEDESFVDVTATERERNGIPTEGIFDLADYQTPSYGFLRADGTTSENDIYVSPNFIRKFNLKPGELVKGFCKKDSGGEKYKALLYVSEVNGIPPYISRAKHKFDDMTPLFPKERFRLSGDSHDKAMRILDLIAPIGKGQRGLIVAPPKSGKTILLQKIAKSIKDNYPDVELMILLIDERPEEVTDMKEYVDAPVFYSTFDELPSNHTKIAELVLSRARGLVEMGKDVVILLDSITRLARAYNVVQPSSGRTLSGGLDTSALHKPKRFLGSARNTKQGGSLTILATALIETGSKMDDVIFEEFKGTGNMELILDRKLSEKRIFPSIDIMRSGTRREELILSMEEYEAVLKIRRALDRITGNDPVEKLLVDIVNTKNNAELVSLINKRL